MQDGQAVLGMAGVGFFGMLLIGFLAGWIAERTMNRDHGVLTNILVGIAGSFVGGTAASLLGFQWYGFVGNLVVATLGAIAILWFFGKREQPAIRKENQQSPPKPIKETPAEKDLPPIYHAKSESASVKSAQGSKANKKPARKKAPAKGKQ